MFWQQSDLHDQSVQIAWEFLERSQAIDDPSEARRFLNDAVLALMERGVLNRLKLSNMAIHEYQQYQIVRRQHRTTRYTERAS
jgi:hypothetical protein